MFEVDSISRSVSLREEGHTISDNSFREDTTYETNACPLVSDFFKITNYEQKGKIKACVSECQVLRLYEIHVRRLPMLYISLSSLIDKNFNFIIC